MTGPATSGAPWRSRLYSNADRRPSVGYRIVRYATATSVVALVAGTFWPTVHSTRPEPVRTTGPVFGVGQARHLISLRHPAHGSAHGPTHAPPRAPTRPKHAAKRTHQHVVVRVHDLPASASVPVTAPPTTTAVPPPPPPPPPSSGCAAAVAAVTARGLAPASGFTVSCPGYALGREGMTCINIPGVCAGQDVIIIAAADPLVVANEFENSRILTDQPARCDTIDCGGAAYGF